MSSITVTPVNPSVVNGLTRQLTATGVYSDGTSHDLTTSAVWSSATPAAATVNTTGLATGVAAGTSVMTATSGSVSGNTTLTVTAETLSSITVTPTNPSIVSGLDRQFTATGTYSNGSVADITAVVVWSSADIAVATMNPNETAGSGLATGVAAGTSVITATLDSVSGNTTLTVTEATLSSITVTPANSSVVNGLTRQFTATGVYSDGTSQDLTATVIWSSGDTAVAFMNPNGTATGDAAGTSVITATSGTVSGNTTLTVTAATLSSIAVTPINPSIVSGLDRQFTATGTYSNGSVADITAVVVWSSADIAVAIMNPNGTTGSGLATGVAEGTSVITATLDSVSGNTTLTVTAATLSSITVTPPNPSVVNGLTRQLTATGVYSDGTSQDITSSTVWSSATPATATVNTTGLATGIAAGSSVITATSGSLSEDTTLTVTAATLSSIAVTPANPSVVNSLTRQFTATGAFSDGTSEDITALATWSSSDINVATMNANFAANSGLATGISAGTAAITATLAGKSGSTNLTVTTATLSSIAVTPVNPSVVNGLTRQFTATGTFSDGTSEDITALATWSSSDINVATMNANFAANSGLATGKSAGTAAITATLAGKSGSTNLTVTTATLSSIAVTPVNPSVVNGLTRQFAATGTFSDGTSENITDSVTWSSGSINVATMNASGAANSGLATGISAGTAAITATLDGKSGSTTLTVTAATLSSITVTPIDPSVVNGLTRQFAATGTYTNGSVAEITALATWTSGDTAVATMNPNFAAGSGLATGIAAGTAAITATLDGKSGSTTLTVTAATLSSIAVTPIDPSVSEGLTKQFTATGTYTDNSTENITASVIWSSDDIAVATMNPNLTASSGRATGVEVGTALITATSGSVFGDTLLNVTEALADNPTVPPLGETERFVILASQAITTTTAPVSAISDGDMGIMDLARTAYAGFTEPADNLGYFDELTNGYTYAHDDLPPNYVVPAPHASTIAFIDTVRDDLTIVARDLEAIPNPGAATQVCPTELGNLTLTRGVYRTTSNVTITTGNLTLNAQGDPDSVWIFQMVGTGTLTTGAPGGSITLINGAQAKNVYWRTAGKTTIGTDTIFQGNIVAWPQINVLTGADVIGRLFSVTEQVTLDANKVTKAP